MQRFRKFFRRQKRQATLSPEQRIAQGEDGERALKDWLDRSHLAYLFLDQRPLTMPYACRKDIKRPDFLVAIEGLGTLAVDAKAKAFIDGHFVLDISERRRLDAFEAEFGLPVWYACFPPLEPQLAYLFRNRDLMGSNIALDLNKQIIRAQLFRGCVVEHARMSFARAMQTAVRQSA